MELTTARLVLRNFAPDDWPAVYEYQRDPRYLRYYAWEDRTPEEVQAFVQRFVDQQAEAPRRRFQLAVTLKSTGDLIGNCGIRQDPKHTFLANIGFEYAPQHWGNGYATEAAGAIVAFGFETLKLHRITADCVADNTGSAHVLQKIGMKLEGRLRDNEFFKGRYWDTLLFAILEPEWAAR